MADKSDPSREFISTAQAAKQLGLSLGAVQQMVECGTLAGWKTAGGHRRIPLKAVETLLAKQTASLEAVHGSPPSTVLIVEDDPVERELYRLRFSEWQFPTTLLLAEDGFEGLVLAGRHAPDLIVADLYMLLSNCKMI